MYKLLNAKENDVKRLVNYEKEIITEFANDLSIEEKKKIDEYVKKSVVKNLKDYKIILFEEKIVGSIELKILKTQTKIINFYIESSFRGKGIGSEILKDILKNNKKVLLWVYKKNLKAKRFYERFNFKVIDESENRFLMECQA